jgi:alanine racemase
MSHSWVEIDLDALRHNVRVLASRLSPTTEIIAMVKGGGYGHGAAEVSRAALSAGASRLGVATLSEAIELRQAGLAAPILVLGGYDAEAADAYFVYELTPVIGDPASLQDLEIRSRRLRRELKVHLHVDTGMGRLGIAPKKAGFLAANLMRSSYLHLEGVSSHLSTADEEDTSYVQFQLRRFRQALDLIQAEGIPAGLVHLSNTAALLRFPDTLAFQAVRPGIGLYGIYPSQVCQAAHPGLAPVLSWRTRVVRVERFTPGSFVSYGRSHRVDSETHVATLSTGYGDGYARAFSGRGQVLIGGKRYPVIGRVTMDHLMVDLGPFTSVRQGDVATLIGQDQEQQLSANELANWIDAIPYEIPTGITPRVERRFQGEETQKLSRIRAVA